ncbi:MAG TPA: hypothetical protein VMT05_02345 [Terriglobales bacterium]|nr:hypothetical protein [Terriglobales bacterium]
MTTLLNRAFVSVVFLLTGTRLGVARILPAPQSSPEPQSAKVFALTEAAWLELRAGGDGAQQDTKSSEEKKKEPPKSSEEKKKEPPKSGDQSKEQSKGEGCDKGGSKSGDEKKGDASKSGECGPGGGDGDMGGSGG